MSVDCRVRCSVSETTVGFCFPGGDSSNIPLDVIQRSSVLSQALLEGSCSEREVTLWLPSATCLHDWLTWIDALPKRRRACTGTLTTDTLINFLNACDYFADDKAIRECCKALGTRLFQFELSDDSAKLCEVSTDSAPPDACQVLNSLTDDFVVMVLREASCPLDFQLQHLKQCWHSHAVHAACPEIVSQGLVKLDCGEQSYTAASTALDVFSKHASPRSLCVLKATLLADFSCSTHPSALQFSFSLDRALRCSLQKVNLGFAAMSEQNTVLLMYALARSSGLQSLRLEFQELTESSQVMLVGVVSQLTLLEDLHIIVHETLNPSEDHESHWQAHPCIHTQPPSILSLRTLTKLKSLTLEGFCCGDHCTSNALAQSLAVMPGLQQLDVAPSFSNPGQVPVLASSISCLSSLSSVVLQADSTTLVDDILLASEVIPQSLVSLSSLRKLHLHMVPICTPDDDLKPLAKAIQSLVCLESLSFEVQEAKTQTLAILEYLSSSNRVIECTSLQLRASVYNSKDIDAPLCQRLCCLTSLQQLSLHMCIIKDNQRSSAVPEENDRGCCSLPMLAALSRLTFLCMDSVIDRDGEDIPEFGAQFSIDGFLRALRSASKLQSLQVSWCTLLQGDMDSLAAAFPALSNLQALSLQYCWSPDSAAATQVASALSCLKSLTRLNLTQSEFGNNSCSGFVEAAAHLSCLKELCMSHNDLERPAAVFTAQALSTFPSLTHLDLSHCNFSALTAEALFQGVRNMRHLLSLDISGVCVRQGSDVLGRSVWPVVAASIAGLFTLRTVLFKECDMPASDTDSVVRALRGLSDLRRVDLRDNTLSSAAVQALQEMQLSPMVVARSECYVLT